MGERAGAAIGIVLTALWAGAAAAALDGRASAWSARFPTPILHAAAALALLAVAANLSRKRREG